MGKLKTDKHSDTKYYQCKCGRKFTLPSSCVAHRGLCMNCINEKRKNYYNLYDFT